MGVHGREQFERSHCPAPPTVCRMPAQGGHVAERSSQGRPADRSCYRGSDGRPTGWDLVLVSRSADALGEVADLCARQGSTALAVVADVADEKAVGGPSTWRTSSSGGVDAVIHSAAALAYGRFEDVPSDVFQAATATTLHGTVNVARARCALSNAWGPGSLVVVGSLLGKIATPFMSTYVTSKWAVHGLVRTLQIEARATPGISISLVSPGGVDTPVYRQAGSYLGVHGRPPPGDLPRAGRIGDRSIHRCTARERSVGPANPLVVLGFRAVPAIFDRVVTPLMRIGGLSDESVRATAGNVMAPARAARVSTAGGHAAPDRSAVSKRIGGRKPMGTPEDSPAVERDIAAPDEVVWSVLADGWSYANWVVGTARVRMVDDGWPTPGRRIHHSVGVWPLLLNDTTAVLESHEPESTRLEARGWPLGKAHVALEVRPDGGACVSRFARTRFPVRGRSCPTRSGRASSSLATGSPPTAGAAGRRPGPSLPR